MSNQSVAATDRRSQVHTEVRRPIEVVLARLVMFVFGFIEVIIAIRFVFKLFGASAESQFVQFIYNLSAVFMAPFEAIFKTQRVAGSTFELSALVAIAMYALAAWGIVALIRALTPREQTRTVERVEKDADARTQ
jgi:signal transduction histidine kinase